MKSFFIYIVFTKEEREKKGEREGGRVPCLNMPHQTQSQQEVATSWNCSGCAQGAPSIAALLLVWGAFLQRSGWGQLAAWETSSRMGNSLGQEIVMVLKLAPGGQGRCSKSSSPSSLWPEPGHLCLLRRLHNLRDNLNRSLKE